MGNGASADAASSASNGPVTTPLSPPQSARSATVVKRNKQFQEVELKPTPSSGSGDKPQSRGQHSRSGDKPQSRGQQHQQQTTSSRNQTQQNPRKGDDVGASGTTGRQSQPNRSSSPKEEDIVFETFYHRSGKEFQCIYQSGMRFYLDDWGSKEWQPFPKRWYNEGLLVTNSIVKDDADPRNSGSGASGSGGNGQGSQGGQRRSRGGGQDDREGYIMHPTRGKLPTYIFYKKHNVHMYMDKDTGSWMRLPIGWELNHPLVKELVDQVEEAIPHWNDRHEILAMLRSCNYDPDECINIYMHLEGDEWLKVPKTAKDAKAFIAKDEKIAELEMKVRNLEIEVQKYKAEKEEAETLLKSQAEKISDLETETKQTEAQLMVLGGRPRTAARLRSKTPAPVVKERVNPQDIETLNGHAMDLRKVHTRLKMDVQRYMDSMKDMVRQLGPAMAKMKASETSQMGELEEVRALYRKEALQRKLLYNQLQELRGNIRVFCRARKDDNATNCLKFPSDQDIVATHPQYGKKIFSFDKVFDPSATQEQIFEDTKPIVSSCVDGYNVCLMAYGQTGSGKTFTMMGPESNPGINIRAVKELFQVCQDRAETQTFTMKVSIVEIYNETVVDLLNSDAKVLELRTAGNKVNIPGITEIPIKAVDDIKKIMKMGDKNRTTASTKMNSTSSRSHLLLMLSLEGLDKVTGAVSNGTLTLCDLAGSERISKTEAEGQRLVEAAAINKSLSALGQVFTALRTSQLHVPYRNSKLTQILQPSLGGDAKACLFVNISPDEFNFQETISTLTFGSSARQIALGQAKQNIKKGPGRGND
ncbi:hypothetical protein CHS0354_039359 [Potamilus streckersoni]|uniref:Kinesin-like protein n=1 Tax=Potamilus streckersoni TaxID=2493646 RepID=A0AAE0W660_9BIVA|nr:hypothetical protein CHS0354_039359 [Potamilus streckersoni]